MKNQSDTDKGNEMEVLKVSEQWDGKGKEQ